MSTPKTVYVHVLRYSDMEMNQGCSDVHLQLQMDIGHAEHVRECDQQEDFDLGREHLEDSPDDAWPWWLDECWEVAEPENAP